MDMTFLAVLVVLAILAPLAGRMVYRRVLVPAVRKRSETRRVSLLRRKLFADCEVCKKDLAELRQRESRISSEGAFPSWIRGKWLGARDRAEVYYREAIFRLENVRYTACHDPDGIAPDREALTQAMDRYAFAVETFESLLEKINATVKQADLVLEMASEYYKNFAEKMNSRMRMSGWNYSASAARLASIWDGDLKSSFEVWRAKDGTEEEKAHKRELAGPFLLRVSKQVAAFQEIGAQISLAIDNATLLAMLEQDYNEVGGRIAPAYLLKAEDLSRRRVIGSDELWARFNEAKAAFFRITETHQLARARTANMGGEPDGIVLAQSLIDEAHSILRNYKGVFAAIDELAAAPPEIHPL